MAPCGATSRGSSGLGAAAEKYFFLFWKIFLLAPITGLGPGRGQILKTSAYQVIKIFESNLGIEHLTFGN